MQDGKRHSSRNITIACPSRIFGDEDGMRRMCDFCTFRWQIHSLELDTCVILGSLTPGQTNIVFVHNANSVNNSVMSRSATMGREYSPHSYYLATNVVCVVGAYRTTTTTSLSDRRTRRLCSVR
uniref:DNA helicase n=1 Tax=Steinernema glaseri TaxID=37863 RepID=A0A1I7ZLZ8_9BILA